MSASGADVRGCEGKGTEGRVQLVITPAPQLVGRHRKESERKQEGAGVKNG